MMQHTGPGSAKSATEEGVADSPEDPMGEEPDGKDEGAGGGGEKGWNREQKGEEEDKGGGGGGEGRKGEEEEGEGGGEGAVLQCISEHVYYTPTIGTTLNRDVSVFHGGFYVLTLLYLAGTTDSRSMHHSRKNFESFSKL